MKNWILLMPLSLLMSSCAYSPQVIHLHPKSPRVQVPAATIHRDVYLKTGDARRSQQIGQRAQGSGHEAAITTDADIAALLRAQITDILKAKGFGIVPAVSPDVPTLDVELQELSYVSFEAAGQHKVKIQIVLEALIKNGLKSYRNTYQAQQERQILLEPVARSNEEWINEVFALVLDQVANDPKLYSALD
jgi:uncharacterized lipoprotein YajG